MIESSLRKRVLSGVSLNAASMFLREAMHLGRSIILARLLAPDDFGLFGMAVTLMGAMRVLTHMHLYGAVIANKFSSDEEVSRQLDTIWTAELVRRFCLTLLLWASIYPTVHFYGDERLYAILLLTSLTPFIQGFQNKGLILLRKKVRFAKVVWYELTSDLIGVVASIGFALWTRSVWALVLSQLLSAVLSVLVSYAFNSYRPRFAFDKSAFKLAFNYGKYMFIIGVMTYITTTADNVVIGKLLGPSVLGIYIVAYSFSSLPTKILYHVLSNVMFPAYAELKAHSAERLKKAFVRGFVITSTLLTIITVPIFVHAEEIIHLLYGAKWDAAGPLLRVLALLGFWRGFVHAVTPLLLGINRPKAEAKAKVFEALIFLALLYPLTVKFGINGAAWAGVIVYFIAFVVRCWYVRTLFREVFGDIMSIVSTTLLAGVCGAISGAFAANVVAADLSRIIVGGSVSIAVIVLIMLLTKPDLRREVTKQLALLRLSLAARKAT